MAIAAVPDYLANQDFSQASPGLRFGMYLPLWGKDNRTGELLWGTHDIKYRTSGREKRERPFNDDNKRDAFNAATALTTSDRGILEALAKRQATMADNHLSLDRLLQVDARAVAPFTTGLGNEHPLENGFAFLNPYGLPYLPGSGVKGVVRQAARELASGAWGEDHGWANPTEYSLQVGGGKPAIALSLADILFGRETTGGSTEHVRGVLTFWDVFPQLAGNRLQVDIMTAHQTHYYQEGMEPHDSGMPNPISFLTVPPGSAFTFHIICDLGRLSRMAPDLAQDKKWQDLVRAALQHAFEWLGFGAKTAVGYGAMELDTNAEKERANAAEARKEDARRAQLTEAQRRLEELEKDYTKAVDDGQLQAGGPVSQKLVKLMAEAEAWSREDRLALANLAKNVYDKMGWGPPKKKREKKDRIAKLRNKQ